MCFESWLCESVSNPNFKRWFGASKVVDRHGQPLAVYHGSRDDFDHFEGDAHYFTDDYFNADGYAGGENVYEVYLRMERPLIVGCSGRKWDDLDTPYGSTTQGVVGNVDRKKYDGVIFQNVKDSWIDDVEYQDPGTVYVVFDATQIKSVENSGNWGARNKNIYE
jgi:hypothetical protein